jgi:hypothetical protein
MKKLYKITSENGKFFECEAKGISSAVGIRSEIFEVTETGEEILLASISKRMRVYIAICIAEYTLNKHSNKSEHERCCLELCRRWVEDPSSVTNDDLYDAQNLRPIYLEKNNLSNAFKSGDEKIFAIRSSRYITNIMFGIRYLIQHGDAGIYNANYCFSHCARRFNFHITVVRFF